MKASHVDDTNLRTRKLVEKKARGFPVLIIETPATMADPTFIDSCNNLY